MDDREDNITSEYIQPSETNTIQCDSEEETTSYGEPIGADWVYGINKPIRIIMKAKISHD
jgi:hypothetical protein